MLSPFPGMDPYLEDEDLWRGAHHWLISASAEQLQPLYERETRRLITGIEIISPSNKKDHETRVLYLRKRKELWAAGVNVVEVDLLRGG